MISVTGIALPYIFISRAMFPGPAARPRWRIRIFTHRRVMLIAMAVPPVVSMATDAMLNGGLARDWNTLWLALRIAAPLTLLAFSSPTAHRAGLGVMAGLLVVGLFR